MASPQDYLPPALSESTILTFIESQCLPTPLAIEPLQVTAAFHSIYLVHFAAEHAAALKPATCLNGNGTISLVLRVSGNHIPYRKTVNEVAIMRWIRQNTSIPVPSVVRFDTTNANVLGSEYTLLERMPGRSVDKMYVDLTDDIKLKLVNQLTDMLIELNKHEWNHIGGLQLDDQGAIVPGPVLEDTFWLVPDIAKYWDHDQSIDTLNPKGPYDTHAELIQAYLRCFINATQSHSSLSWLSDLVPRLEPLIDRAPNIPSLSSTRLILAHKDLHFANVMALPDGTITAILDWEFAGVVPSLRWDPVRAFLWSAEYSDPANAEKARMRAVFEAELDRRDVTKWWECKKDASTEVDNMWEVIRFVRALVEVCPRNQRADMVGAWKKSAERALTMLAL